MHVCVLHLCVYCGVCGWVCMCAHVCMHACVCVCCICVFECERLCVNVCFLFGGGGGINDAGKLGRVVHSFSDAGTGDKSWG